MLRRILHAAFLVALLNPAWGKATAELPLTRQPSKLFIVGPVVPVVGAGNAAPPPEALAEPLPLNNTIACVKAGSSASTGGKQVYYLPDIDAGNVQGAVTPALHLLGLLR
jgi:hypothetical protein